MNIRQKDQFTKAAHIMRVLNLGPEATIEMNDRAIALESAVDVGSIKRVHHVILDLELQPSYNNYTDNSCFTMIALLLRGYMI